MNKALFTAGSLDAPSIAAYLSIVHHIPGRIRLKLAAGAEIPGHLSDAVRTLRDGLDKNPAIRSIRLNMLAKSCVIEYDPEQIAPDAWNALAGDMKMVDSLAAVLFENFATKPAKGYKS
ncbi:hypothetical protein FACS1894205_1070 [Alphaproteobacteria bacterium]|nr:hypothetical protein FACS1894205_1070 [Alphaproteobacteria bacterium]